MCQTGNDVAIYSSFIYNLEYSWQIEGQKSLSYMFIDRKALKSAFMFSRIL